MFGKITEADAIVQRSECAKLADVLTLLGIPFTTGTCHLRKDFSELVFLELLIPALEGYKFDFEDPLSTITVLNTTFVFNPTYGYRDIGPVGCFLLAFSTTGHDFKIRSFENFSQQYNLADAIKAYETAVKRKQAAQLEKDRKEYERLKEKFGS